MPEMKPPHWLSVAVRQGLVLREGSPNTDFRCTEVTLHVWEAMLDNWRDVDDALEEHCAKTARQVKSEREAARRTISVRFPSPDEPVVRVTGSTRESR